MLWNRGIRRGIEVLVHDEQDERAVRKARVLRTYPRPSDWLVIQYEDGEIKQIREHQVTTMFEANDKGLL